MRYDQARTLAAQDIQIRKTVDRRKIVDRANRPYHANLRDHARESRPALRPPGHPDPRPPALLPLERSVSPWFCKPGRAQPATKNCPPTWPEV
jgi:hypothetical protein